MMGVFKKKGEFNEEVWSYSYSISTRGILVIVETIFRMDSLHNSFVSTELYRKYPVSAICVSIACVVEEDQSKYKVNLSMVHVMIFFNAKAKAITLQVSASADQITEVL